MKLNIILFLMLGTGAAGAAILLFTSSAQGQASTTLETILKAWKDRQQSIKSARFAWTERQTVPKGSLTESFASIPDGEGTRRELGIGPGAIVPPQDTVLENVASSLSVDGNKFRYQYDGREWSGKKNEYEIKPRWTAFNGNVGTALYPGGGTTTPWPQAYVHRNYPDRSSLPLNPLVMFCRPFLVEMNVLDPETLSLPGRSTVIDGKRCLELERRRGEFVQRLWVCPSCDYLVLRSMSLTKEQMRSCINVRYRRHPEKSWVPEGWDLVVQQPGGKLETSVRATVTQCETNLALEPAEFEITLPLGTRVHDSRDPRAPVDYIVQEGGRKRIILLEELGATYDQLVTTETGEARGNQHAGSSKWGITAQVVVVITLGGMIVWRVGSRRASQRKNDSTNSGHPEPVATY